MIFMCYISEYVDFGWYDLVYYYDKAAFPNLKTHVARWLGVVHRVGQALCYWLLTQTGQVIARTSVIKILKDDMASDVFRLKLQAFDSIINDRFKNRLSNKDILETSNIEEDQLNDVYLPFEEEAVVPEEDEIPDTEACGQYITAHVLLPRNDTYEKATNTCRKRDNNGNLIGHAHTNPLLDTRIYEVQFPDGASSE